jgi:hypothetical protein
MLVHHARALAWDAAGKPQEPVFPNPGFPMADDIGIVTLPHMEGCGLSSGHRGACRMA